MKLLSLRFAKISTFLIVFLFLGLSNFQACAPSFKSDNLVTTSQSSSALASQAPTLLFSSNLNSLLAGAAATLTWSATSATVCVGSGSLIGSQSLRGSLVVRPSVTSTYVLTCSNAMASVSQSVTVAVLQPVPTVNLTLEQSTIAIGQSTAIVWTSSNATTCNASDSWAGLQALAGRLTLTPTTTGSLTYSLRCVGPGGATSQSAILTVSNAASPPSITLSANPSTVTSGGSANLTWSTLNVTTCTASGAWAGTKATSGSLSISPNATSVYSLTCANSSGSSANQSVTVTVNPPLPTLTFIASPMTIAVGESSTLTWTATNASSCTASGAWSGTKANSGLAVVSPSATSTYNLICHDASGNALTQSVIVNVITPNLGPPPADPLATPRTRSLLAFLTGLSNGSSTKIVSGQFQGWNTYTTHDIEHITTQSGVTVGLAGVSYSFSLGDPLKIAFVNNYAIDFASQGGIISMDFHLDNPNDPGGLNNPNNVDFVQLITPGTATNTNFNQQLDYLAAGLAVLQQANVPVILRYFLEMNGGWFWWGSRDPLQYKNAWIYVFNYFTQVKGLHNLLFAYNPNAGSGRITDFYPGPEYVDLVGIDIYGVGLDLSQVRSDYLELIALNKPFAIAEFGTCGGGSTVDCDRINYTPLISNIQSAMPKSVYWMNWSEHWSMDKQNNIINLLNDPAVLNRGQFTY